MISLKTLDQALVNGFTYNHSAHLLTFPPGSINVMILKKPGEPDINLKYLSQDAQAISSVLLKHRKGSPVQTFS